MSKKEIVFEEMLNIVPETCKFDKVKLVSKQKDNTYKFVGILIAPTGLDDIKISLSEIKELVSLSSFENKEGKDIIHTIKFKDDEKRTRFDFTTHLAPKNIEEIKVEDGLFKIKCTCYGKFY